MFEIVINEFKDMEKLLELFCSYGNFYCKGQTFFLFAIDSDFSLLTKKLSKILGVGNFIIKKIEPSQYASYNTTIGDWMKQRHYEYDIEKLEKEEQTKIKDYMDVMERFENFLASESKAGDISG